MQNMSESQEQLARTCLFPSAINTNVSQDLNSKGHTREGQEGSVRASLFPSAGATKKIVTEDEKPQAETESGDNDLETLRLTLPPSAINAIIAAQSAHGQIISEASGSFLENSDRRDNPFANAEKLSSDHTSDEDVAVQEDEIKERVKRKMKKHKHKHKHKKLKRDYRSESPPLLADAKPVKIPAGAVFFEDIRGLRAEHAFHIDRKKNKDLWHYQSISSRHISKYKSFSRSCLGNSNIMLDKKEPNKHKKSADLARYFGRVGLRQIHGKGTALKIDVKKVLSGAEFIPIPKSSDQSLPRKELDGASYSCLDQATSLYVQGKGSDYSNNADSEAADRDFVMDEIFEKIRIFNQRTRNEPQNVRLWLEFVAFQDVVAQREKTKAAGLSQTLSLGEMYRPTKSVIEKKLAILEKAVESNPSSLELKLAQLALYQDIWETDKLEKAWEDLLFVHSGKADLWREYLARQQCSSLQGFTVSRVVKRFHKCFQTLASVMDGQVKVIQKASDIEEQTIGIFSQYCSFLHMSGYTERAVATFQALIEFNLHCPSSLNLTSTRDRAVQFEKFWESSTPRFGEEGAKGWTKWAEQKSKGIQQSVSFVDVSTEEEEDAIILEQLPRSQTWIKMEKLRENSHILPWRPDALKDETEDSAEDPERLVLFDDVAPTLFRLTKSESCLRIVCLFLKFLGMPSATLNERIQQWEQEKGGSKFEQYLGIKVSQFPQLSQCNSANDMEKELPVQKQLLVLLNNAVKQAESYFSLSNRTFFTLLRLDCNILEHGAKTVSEVPSSGVKDIKKFGKNLLKESQNRNNLILWDTYIRLLWACSDKIAETVSMVETALGMFMGTHNTTDPEKKYGVCCLCLTYCQILLNFEPLEHIEASLRRSAPTQHDKRQVMRCLGALVENKVFKPGSATEISPAYILKIRSLFHKCISDYAYKLQMTNSNICQLFCILTDCFALFEYCASNFKKASDSYESARLIIQKNEQDNSNLHGLSSITRKNLHLRQLSFTMNMLQISIIPIETVRKVINNGLTEFPECSKLLEAFIKLEERSHIAGRLRQFYYRSLRNATDLSVPLFAVVSEMKRHEKIVATTSIDHDIAAASSTESNDTGIVHRLRSVFETVLSLSVSNHSPLLWRLYLYFEFKYGSETKAKGILYRALQSCPWAKCIFMDGISLFGDSELQEMTDLMTEEEIRVRMPYEELDLLLTAEKEEPDNDEIVKEESGNEDIVKEEPDNEDIVKEESKNDTDS
ncbi:hypothetical protein EGW08_013979 [Elysia chlorotica]|uniref:Protein NRDE2 homolog n=1 Tax=Elysia chlorotica TaxID=188477 RepID=A0A3S1BDJ5_ELYCH|nr:hypothetical protein EGW08_013979 [Elysia chlorotica]